MKKVISLCCAIFILFTSSAYATEKLNTSAKSVLLMEADTGKILYEDNADEQLPIASVTKIMTLLLTMEALDSGKITMDDEIPVSERAMSMGGSTMFLESGESLSVREMVKGIAVASANDGCVAMAEYLEGSVESFVAKMNARAKELGMKNTNFINTNGLDDDNHYSSARDVALMSRELLKHDEIFEFTTIWTDKMHNGKFDLANTNKLIRFYQGANGLKTGSTSKALCCISATAERDGMQLIGVVLGAPTSKDRFADARTLLDYGFANYKIEKPIKKGDSMGFAMVKKGKKDTVSGVCEKDLAYLLSKGNKEECEVNTIINEVNAPIKSGDVIGTTEIVLGGEKLGECNIIANEDVDKKGFIETIFEFLLSII